MSDIEWHSDNSLEPQVLALDSFCKARSIPCPQAGEGHFPLVFVNEIALEGLNEFLESDLSREHGGILAGQPYFDPVTARYFVDIRAAIPALHSEGTPVHMQFNAEAWDYISGLLEESFPDQIILGWYHSHPGLGVFMSGVDRDTHQAFYNRPWNLALVVDPVYRLSGWFAGPECRALVKNQVVLYRRKAEAHSTTTGQPSPPGWEMPRWFLPLAMLSLALLVLVRVGARALFRREA
jgi:proteasome lid subunit RPN8/RPN11